MAPPTDLSHRRTHNLLLISKLLSLRDTTSPLALILDSLEQPAQPLIREYIRRAQISKLHVTFISFETLGRPDGVDAFISCRQMRPSEIVKEVANVYNQTSPSVSSGSPHRRLLIIDSINALVNSRGPESPIHLPSFLSSLVISCPPPSNNQSSSVAPTQTSLIVTYHQDITISTSTSGSAYSPSPLSLLTYMATTIFTLHSFIHILAEKAALDRSLQPPIFGLEEQLDGVIIGHVTAKDMASQTQKPADNSNHRRAEYKTAGIVIEMEHRRKSGRGVLEWYFLPSPAFSSPSSLPSPTAAATATATTTISASGSMTAKQQGLIRETVMLLDDHPLYRRLEDSDLGTDNVLGGGGEKDETDITTFELGLTERQRRERDAVVLPYFDAQKGDGPGEGGRILYDMGEEDDFDEEEDEI